MTKFKKVFKILFIIVFILLFVVLLKKPDHDKNWEIESRVLPSVEQEGGLVKIKNVRDFKYSEDKILSYDYIDREIDISKVKKLYFIIEPFAKWDAVAHSFFSFDIEGQEPISFSVEARREEGENYSAVKGLFNEYELWYVWGTENDLIVRRGLYLDHPLIMYEVEATEEYVQGLFGDLIQKTKDLENNPRFYNTVASNCTNVLAESANKVKEKTVPPHYSLVLTGYSDEYLYKLGFVSNETSLEDLKKKNYITDFIKENYQEENFSELLRNFISK